jgi:F-type H+-transporting ATPase subunit b
MLIDWFTVSAQIINFLILVWLMKRFLYKPILVAINTREKYIADQSSNAAALQASAKKSQDEYTGKISDFDKTKAAALTAVQTEADTHRESMLNQLKTELTDAQNKQKESLAAERLSMTREIVELSCKEIFSVARKTLTDLSNVTLEASMADVLVSRLNALSTEARTQFINSLKNGSQDIVVLSTFDLPQVQQKTIVAAVSDMLSTTRAFQFKTEPDQVCGIELSTQDYKVSWTIGDYLTSLEAAAASRKVDEVAA